MASLAPALRKKLEDAVKEARDVAEAGARAALEQLAVHAAEPFAHLGPEDRELRNRLRARARQLGDGRDTRTGAHQIDHLVVECAYEHWHRMLFARFLAENGVLMANSEALGIENTPVTLEECEELAADEGAANGWELAGRYASKMLPQIFRPDAPVLAVHLPPERQRRLEQILAELATETFKASDALGWVYQFWQAKKKDEVNASGVKIGADELPAVTQLFTEPYMVEFLLHNTLGAWWAGKVLAERPELARTAKSEEELREACSVPECSWRYLRFVNSKGTWMPASGCFEDWPRNASELRVLDPCCGSGHFLVAAFELVFQFRIIEEQITPDAACAAVLENNIFGLELDPRCAEIAAFAVWLTAARRATSVGPISQIAPRVACIGIPPRSSLAEWVGLVQGADAGLKAAMSELHGMFSEAALTGSLLDPSRVGTSRGGQRLIGVSGWSEARAAVQDALRLTDGRHYEHVERAIAARGMLDAVGIVEGRYHLVVTNPPYLVRGKQSPRLQAILHSYCPDGDADLATVFVRRCGELLLPGGAHATVTPQNWLFLKSYSAFRRQLLSRESVVHVTRVGSGATATASWDVLRALVISVNATGKNEGRISGLEAEAPDEDGRAEWLRTGEVLTSTVGDQRSNPDCRLALAAEHGGERLEVFADSLQGISSGDVKRFGRQFWEVPLPNSDWSYWQGTVSETCYYGGRDSILFWESGRGQLVSSAFSAVRGLAAQGRQGVAVTQMRNLPATIFSGTLFDTNVAAVVPKDQSDLLALWTFLSSDEFNVEVRKLDQKINVTNATLAKVPFDRERWRELAQRRFPNGLPSPETNEPTQWIFSGLVREGGEPYAMQVAVARLLGYSWPEQRSDGLGHLVDEDGIVPIGPIRGEEPAGSRLADLLAASFGQAWTVKERDALLAAVGAKGKGLDWWLQNKFFEQHCQLFQHRPFIWHIWDGIKKDGFGALVNYHKLDRKLLETLTYTYLGDWIRRQQDDAARNVDGASERLDAARRLQQSLELILEGEKPYDIFVRWKPLHEQPIGWDPDLNDGVRLNIRPFMSVPDVDKKGAGVLRYKPNIHWNKDRGTDPDDAPWFELGPSYGEPKGARINDHHLSLAEKRAARERAGGR